jgi:hypothetical protein
MTPDINELLIKGEIDLGAQRIKYEATVDRRWIESSSLDVPEYIRHQIVGAIAEELVK